MNHRRSYEFVYQFASVGEVLAAIPSLGPLYAQGRVRGAGLAKGLESVSPIQLPGLDFVCDPDVGVAFSTPRLRAVQGGLGGASGRLGDVLEFEFASFPGALSLHKFPTMPLAASIREAVGALPGWALGEERVSAWQSELPSIGPLCRCCRERAAQRCAHPEREPIFRILRHAVEAGLHLEFRITSDCVDLSARFVPAKLSMEGPCLVATDAAARHACHLDLRVVHRLSIRRRFREGGWFSSLQAWNVYGEPQIEILVEGEGLAARWAGICEGMADGV